MILNPIIQREFVSSLRSKSALAALCGMALLFTTLVVLRWPSDALVDLSGAQSQEVFRMFGYGLITAILLLAPIFPASSIVREKVSGTLQLLLNSPMSAASIYLGKLTAFLGVVALMLMMSFPAASACSAMGGMSLSGDVMVLYLLLLAAALQCTAVALLVSTYANSTDAALRWTYGAVLAFAVLTLGPHFFLQGKGTSTALAAEWLRCLSPIPAVMELMRQEGLGARGLVVESSIVSRFLMLALGLSALLAVWTILRLSHRTLDKARSQGVITDERSQIAQWARRLFFLVDPQRRKRGISFLTNPVMVKEFRCRRFGRFHWMLRLAAISAIVSLGLTFASTLGASNWGAESIGGIMVLLQAALIVLITPSLASGLISTEVESGGWPLLQMTPLSGFKILRGKIFSVIWPMLLILVSTVPGYLVMVWIEPEMWLTIRQVLICLGMTGVFSLFLSMAVSSLCKRTALATTISYSGLAIVCAGTMLVWLLRDAPFGHVTVEMTLLINPIAHALHVMNTPGFTHYTLVPRGWWTVGGAIVICFMIVLVQTHRLTKPR